MILALPLIITFWVLSKTDPESKVYWRSATALTAAMFGLSFVL